MDYSLGATYYRTALLLGLVRGEVVQAWAEQAIEREPELPRELVEVVSVPPTDLSALRQALWPLVAEPEPREVLEAMLGLLHADLSSGRRGLSDTLTVLRQMRSMLRLPAPLYADLNSALVAYSASGGQAGVIVEWLAQFAQSNVDLLQSNR
jgi:hypothetical protein